MVLPEKREYQKSNLVKDLAWRVGEIHTTPVTYEP